MLLYMESDISKPSKAARKMYVGCGGTSSLLTTKNEHLPAKGNGIAACMNRLTMHTRLQKTVVVELDTFEIQKGKEMLWWW